MGQKFLLIYRASSPHVEEIKSALLARNLPLEEIVWDDLPEKHELRLHATPSLIYGIHYVIGEAASTKNHGLTPTLPTESEIEERLELFCLYHQINTDYDY